MSIIFSVGILALCCLVVWRETRSMVDVAAITANAVSTTSRSDAEEPWQPSVPPIHTCRIENGTVAIPTSAPRFVIIGAQKCATTTLFELLRQHPDINMPLEKEVPFFTGDDCSPQAWDESLAWTPTDRARCGHESG